MHFYYVRYNVYPNGGAPVEHEQWLQLDGSHDEKQIKDMLSTNHKAQVTIIQASPINEEQHQKREKAR